MRANTRLVRDSATAILAPASQFTKPFIGCSPIAVAAPSYRQTITYVGQSTAHINILSQIKNNILHCLLQ